MSRLFKDTESIVDAALAQLTPEMLHVCILPASMFVKITRIVHVVRSEMLLRADEASPCPPGSQDLQQAPHGGHGPPPPPHGGHAPPPPPHGGHAPPPHGGHAPPSPPHAGHGPPPPPVLVHHARPPTDSCEPR